MNLQTPNHLLFKTPFSTYSTAKPMYISLHSFSSNPTYSPFYHERSINNSPDNFQISNELDNFITLKQQLRSRHTLNIHQLSSTITSSNPPIPTPISDNHHSLNHPFQQKHPLVLTELIETLNVNFQINRFHPNPEPPENI